MSTNPLARTSPAEIAEAMNNGRALAAQLRAARQKREQITGVPTLRQNGLLMEQIAGLRGDLQAIANRAFLDLDVLISLLDAEHFARVSNGRRPSAEQLKRAMRRILAQLERDEPQAHEAAKIATEKAAQLTRDRVAAAAAGMLMGVA
ncbi:hypothetical protein [Sphingomonas dokdonensis]|uniref:Uncharacterized protein n=1 Tax=Sphingomonas dokdonensis TaxID=344880 RepID=A0A245ZWF9_9SPHN|nr:hypothetical protein [Sphingomonas dokdonensis]OWK34088.1 hypothetical protein SPDO_09790 [Sphingomonas dokdonensis]